MDLRPGSIHTVTAPVQGTVVSVPVAPGDAVARGAPVAVLEALTGQVFLATLVARLVSAYRGSARRNPSSGDSADGRPVSYGRLGGC